MKGKKTHVAWHALGEGRSISGVLLRWVRREGELRRLVVNPLSRLVKYIVSQWRVRFK